MTNYNLQYSLFQNNKVIHFTTKRHGGVSKGNYESMNPCPYARDNLQDVAENRRLLAERVGVAEKDLYIPFQTHEDRIRIIDSTFQSLSEEEKETQLYGVDALITAQKDVCIGITTADCVPILIYDTEKHILAAAHAGWKSTVKRIAAKTVLMMKEELGSNPTQLVVAIGPSISQTMFEVGDEVGTAFANAGFDLSTISYRKQETSKLHIDLWQANKEQLLSVGIQQQNIEVAGICTFQNNDYFSARRQTIDSGRMLTGGVLK